jgi:hypothetical protein
MISRDCIIQIYRFNIWLQLIARLRLSSQLFFDEKCPSTVEAQYRQKFWAVRKSRFDKLNLEI